MTDRHDAPFPITSAPVSPAGMPDATGIRDTTHTTDTTGMPVTPDATGIPDTTHTTDTTGMPVTPDTTGMRDATHTTDTTGMPDTTRMPVTPDTTRMPVTPDTTGMPDTTGAPDTTRMPVTPDTTGIAAFPRAEGGAPPASEHRVAAPRPDLERMEAAARLLEAAASGDRRALARLLSWVERGGEPGRACAALAYRAVAEPRTVGITGAPGAGKSTLTGCLLGVIARSESGPVAVLAVDPTSPYSGGAMLGDRVRMQDQAAAAGVYVRSMATRGHLGGLSLAVPEAIRVLGAAGMSLVVVETVGVGQVEVDVASATDTTVVVVNPRWGDAIQANKAGLMEVADIFVVNKADQPGAAETRRDLQQMLDLAGHHAAGRRGELQTAAGAAASESAQRWRPPIVETVAASGQGADELWQAILAHQQYLDGDQRLQERRRTRLERELQRVLDARITAEVARLGRGAGAEVLAAVLDHRLDPYEAADQIVGAAVRVAPASGGTGEAGATGDRRG